MSSGVFRSGNLIRLLCSGKEYFPALENAINNARQEIYLESYIYADDETGRKISAALMDAVSRGVNVNVIVDGFGSRAYAGKLLDKMRKHGVHVLVFRPEVVRWRFHRRRLRRLHRKLVVIDGEIAFIGGINIIDDQHAPIPIPHRFDYAVEIRGPLLSDIHSTATGMWRHLHWTHFKLRSIPRRKLEKRIPEMGDMTAALLVRDNVHHRRDIEAAYLTAIQTAQKEIIISNAYFLPGIHFRQALTEAASRGVKIILLLQGRVEYFLFHYATRGMYETFLKENIDIYEYRASFLHAKVAVIDEEWATVGSSNIDPFSLLLAREANVVVKGEAFAKELRKSLMMAMDDNAVSIKTTWKKRTYFDRILTWICYGLVRFLMGIVGYAQD